MPIMTRPLTGQIVHVGQRYYHVGVGFVPCPEMATGCANMSWGQVVLGLYI